MTPEDTVKYYIDMKFGAPEYIQTYYHYTTIEALLNGIIVDKPEEHIGKEICLWATHSSFLNDPTELEIGLDIVKDLLKTYDPSRTFDDWRKGIQNLWGNIFITSFSQRNDSLPMWNMYAKNGTGIALGFERLLSRGPEEVVLKCWYDEDELLNTIKDDNSKADELIIAYYLPQMLKNEAYDYEKEVRLCGQFLDSSIKFREKNGYVIPYKEVFFSKEQIKSITLGPCVNMKDAEFSLRQFLDSRGFEHVKIEHSKITYRNL